MNVLTRCLLSMVATAIAVCSAAHRQDTRHLAIDEGIFVDINGLDQWLTIRGRDVRNPVILLLHGGPGVASSHLAPLYSEWENEFTRVSWDQPGGGATAVKTSDQGTITLQRFVRDGISVAEFVRARLGVQKLILFGSSWGTRLGLEMVRQRPDLFLAYVGNGQVVGAKGYKLGYELALTAARERGDVVAVQALERVGAPPYAKLEDFLVRQQYTNPPGFPPSPEERAATAAMTKVLSAPLPPDAHYIAYRNLPPNFDGGKVFLATQRAIFQESGSWEARDLGIKFSIPIFIFQGERDINTPTTVAKEYFDEIVAPKKAFEIIPGAGHNPVPFHNEILALLKTHVLPLIADEKRR